ncbi:MAG: hypothetical protein SNI45_05445 [Rikenellaceae bacterium]
MAKDQLWRGGRITNLLSRFGHFRGRGIHSPFIYYVVRNVFLSRKLQHVTAPVFEQLTAINLNSRTATELANFAYHCEATTVAIDRNDDSAKMIICSTQCPDDTIEALFESAATNGTSIVILTPYKRRALCNSLLKRHCCTSIDRFKYLAFLNNHLPKQHFKL